MSTRKALTVRDLRMEDVARLAAGGALFVVAASFIYSFAQIKWVSDQLGVEAPWLSWLFPLIIDAPALVASALTVALHDRPLRVRQWAWTVLVLFTSASWACNAVHALTFSSIDVLDGGPAGDVLVVLMAGFAPVGVVLGVHLWAFALRWSPTADQRAPERESRRSRSRTPEASAPTSASVSAPGERQEPAPSAPVSAPERPAAAPVAVRTPATDEAPERASADEVHDRAGFVWAELRAETPDGKPVDAATMRRRLVERFGEEAVPPASTVRRWRAKFEREQQPLAAAADVDAVGETRESVAV